MKDLADVSVSWTRRGESQVCPGQPDWVSGVTASPGIVPTCSLVTFTSSSDTFFIPLSSFHLSYTPANSPLISSSSGLPTPSIPSIAPANFSLPRLPNALSKLEAKKWPSEDGWFFERYCAGKLGTGGGVGDRGCQSVVPTVWIVSLSDAARRGCGLSASHASSPMITPRPT